MAFLTIGGTPVEIQHSGASEEDPDRGGELTRAFAGNLRSSFKYRKRKWSFTSGILTQAAYDTLVALDNGVPINCSGDALSGATVSCVVQIQGGDYLQDGGIGHVRDAAIHLFEV